MLFNNKYTIHIEYILKRKWDLREIMALVSYFDFLMMLTLDRFAKKNPPEINVLNKNGRYKITVGF